MLLAMEGRLATKLNMTNTKVDKALSIVADTNTALEDLEVKVGNMEYSLDAKLEGAERRIQDSMKNQVKELVVDQLRAIGFDSDISASDFLLVQKTTDQRSYEGVTSAPTAGQPTTISTKTKQDRQEEKFWICWRSLRLWPVKDASRKGLEDFLRQKLWMEDDFIRNDLGPTHIRRHFERKSKTKDEVLRHIRD